MAEKKTPVSPHLEPQLKELNTHLDRLATIGFRNVSFKYALALSVVRGAGYAIGATVVAGIAVALLVQLIKTANTIPILGPALQNEVIQNNLPFNE